MLLLLLFGRLAVISPCALGFTSIGINVHRSLLIWVELSCINSPSLSLAFHTSLSLIRSCEHNFSPSFTCCRFVRKTFPFFPLFGRFARAFTSSNSSHLLHARFQDSCHEACIIRNHSIKSSSIFPYIVSGHFCLAPDINLFFHQCVCIRTEWHKLRLLCFQNIARARALTATNLVPPMSYTKNNEFFIS